jgi:hypothetical protein
MSGQNGGQFTDFDPNEDWLPPLKPPPDDLVDVQTSWGVMPKWKARALAIGEIQALLRQDDSTQMPAPKDEQPREIVADGVWRKFLQNKIDQHRAKIDQLRECDEYAARLEERCDALSKNLAAKQAAHAELLRVEELLTAKEDPDETSTEESDTCLPKNAGTLPSPSWGAAPRHRGLMNRVSIINDGWRGSGVSISPLAKRFAGFASTTHCQMPWCPSSRR